MRRLTLAVVVCVLFSLPLTAATFSVNSLADTSDASAGNGVCDDGSGKCTLRGAIQEANALAGADVITFSVTGTITLGSTLPAIGSQIAINGPGATSLIVSAGSNSYGFNIVTGGDNSSIQNVGISGGNTYGINIANASNITISSNYIGAATPGMTACGVGINISGSASAITIQNNRIGGSGGGTGVYVGGAGTVTIIGNYIGVQADGTTAAGFGYGVYVLASNVTIGSSGAGNVISGNASGAGVYVGSGLSNVLIKSNYLGTNAAGTAAIANLHGVIAQSPVQVGGSSAGTGNVISGNTIYGVGAIGGGSTIVGNYIGTNAAGTVAIGNNIGVRFWSSGTLGGTSAGARNVISGNYVGVSTLAGGSGAVIEGNYIGTNANGDAAIGNAVGVDVAGTSDQIGVDVLGGGNLISGNSDTGVQITGNSNTVRNNVIGTNAAQTAAIANGYGIRVPYTGSCGNVTGTFIGGSNTYQSDVISGNSNAGIQLECSAASSAIVNNWIGVSQGGSTAIPNATGINLSGDTGSAMSNNTIAHNSGSGIVASSTNDTIQANTITNNGADGVSVVGSSSGVLISSNGIDANTGLGIDLNDDGVTANDYQDPDSGPNRLQNYPVITSATGTTVTGTLNSLPNTAFTIELFQTIGSTDEGATYIGSAVVTTDANGDGAFSATVPTLTQYAYVTGTARNNGTYDTSEFSAAVLVPGPGIFDFSSPTYSQNENGGSVTLTVNRSGGAVGIVTVDYATADGSATGGSDYSAESGTLTFNPGETSKTIVVPILDDSLYEGDETFTVTLSNPNGGSSLGTTTKATVTIIDDESVPSITIDDPSVVEGNAGTTVLNFTVTLSNASATDVTVNYATSNGTATAGSDYVATSGTLTIPAGSLTGTISVTVNGDTTGEADETVRMNLSNATGGATIADTQGVGTITNDDDLATIPTMSTWMLLLVGALLVGVGIAVKRT